MLFPCICKHADQDAIHGSGKRVHNTLPKSEKQPQRYRCTVCGNTREGVMEITSSRAGLRKGK